MLQAQAAYKEQQVDEKEDQEQLIMNDLPQVYYIARRIHERLPQQVPLEDLVHAGVIGLIEAVRSYDPSKGAPLKSYAKFRIRGAILDSLRELDWGSRRLRHKGRQIEEAISKLSKQLERQPEEEEIAAELGISIDELFDIAHRIDGAILVGQQVSSTYDRSEKQDLIESAPSRDENPFEQCVRTEVKDQLAKVIATLSEKEQLVISLYYKEELTMKEIAAVLQLRESRISQIHTMALSKLRAALQNSEIEQAL
ncbi:MAG: FliA/WhiG family RNA polymerase sigma factor [Candidatus Sulfotelmatobacter sp.]|jgi:RNA polymerase sigma factor FliA